MTRHDLTDREMREFLRLTTKCQCSEMATPTTMNNRIIIGAIENGVGGR